MPTFVFRCESCGERRPFLVHDPPADTPPTAPIQKHCPTCHTVTNWVQAALERRSGKDRRASDRRLPE
ncbi:MAG TPA: hypothetical protein VGA40_01455 [Candidatus Acidoferrales bacterium]